MILAERMFQGFNHGGCRDRTRDEGNADWLELFGREGFGRQAGPKTVTISGNGREPGDSIVPNKIVNLGALDVRCTEVAGAKVSLETRIANTGPRQCQTCWQVLRICAHIKRSDGVGPDFPCRLRFPQTFQKPRLLFCSENGGRWLILPEICNVPACKFDGRRRTATVIGISCVQYFEDLLWHKSWEVSARKGLSFCSIRGFLGPVASLVCDDQFYVASPAHRPISPKAVDGCQIIWFLP